MKTETYPVPENRFGIVAVHSKGGPFSDKELTSIFEGPIASIEDELILELAKIAEF